MLGPCTKEGTDYYWCRRGSALDSSGNWEYCSPDVGLTRYELRCKSSHPCAKHGGEDYYWCYVETNSFGWDWDYCSPPFDLYEVIEDGSVDLTGNYGSSHEGTCQARRKRSPGNDNPWLEFGRPRDRWPNYPFLYRMLANGFNNRGRYINEGDGLQGLQSRSLYHNQERPTINQRVQIPLHVASNPERTPWISTSANLDRQDCVIRDEIARRLQYTSNVRDIYLVTIDVRYLDANRNRVVNLADSRVRNSLLRVGSTANNYARVWDEVLIFWDVPSRAIVSTRRYYMNRYTMQIEYEDYSNPNYDGRSSQIDVKHEDFIDEDNLDRSNYPNY